MHVYFLFFFVSYFSLWITQDAQKLHNVQINTYVFFYSTYLEYITVSMNAAQLQNATHLEPITVYARSSCYTRTIRFQPG